MSERGREVERSIAVFFPFVFWLLIDSSSLRFLLSLSLSRSFPPSNHALTSRKKSRTFVSEETASSTAAGGVGRRPIWARAASERRIGSLLCFFRSFVLIVQQRWLESTREGRRSTGARVRKRREMEIKESGEPSSSSFSSSFESEQRRDKTEGKKTFLSFFHSPVDQKAPSRLFSPSRRLDHMSTLTYQQELDVSSCAALARDAIGRAGAAAAAAGVAAKEAAGAAAPSSSSSPPPSPPSSSSPSSSSGGKTASLAAAQAMAQASAAAAAASAALAEADAELQKGGGCVFFVEFLSFYFPCSPTVGQRFLSLFFSLSFFSLSRALETETLP